MTSAPGPELSGKTPPHAAFRWRLLAAAASAILLVLACPPADQGWLAWLAPPVFFWALLPAHPASDARRRTPFWLGFVHGFLLLVLMVPWFGAFSPAGYPVAGVYWGLLAGLVWVAVMRAVQAMPRVWTPPLLAAGWTLIEWLRTQGTLSFPWGSLAVTQHRYLAVLQMLDLTGAFGLSFLMALVGASVVFLFRTGSRMGQRWVLTSVGLLLAAVVRGTVLLALPQPAAPTVRAAVVQASESEQEGVAVRTLSPPDEYLSRSREAIRNGAELVVWPEAARLDDVVRSGYAQAQIGMLLRGTHASLLTGSFVRYPETGETQNAGVLFGPDGQVLGEYAKVLIVPFGEYLPLRPLLRWTEQLGMPATDLRPGKEWEPLGWERGRIGVSICFESAFGSVSRTHVRRGANLLAVLTSDGWVGRTSAGYQHAAFAPLRAVENRRSIARAAATGVSALIDPLGRRIRTLPMFEKGYAVADLPLRTGLTPYARLGDWPVMLSGLLVILGLVRSIQVRPGGGLWRVGGATG